MTRYTSFEYKEDYHVMSEVASRNLFEAMKLYNNSGTQAGVKYKCSRSE